MRRAATVMGRVLVIPCVLIPGRLALSAVDPLSIGRHDPSAP